MVEIKEMSCESMRDAIRSLASAILENPIPQMVIHNAEMVLTFLDAYRESCDPSFAQSTYTCIKQCLESEGDPSRIAKRIKRCVKSGKLDRI